MEGHMSVPRIGLLTTLKTNIGDDLIRLGIERLLRRAIGGPVRFEKVNKHEPWTAYGRLNAGRLFARLSAGRKRRPSSRWRGLARRCGQSRFHDCNMIIQCGAPVLWPGCHACEWAEPVWYGIIGEVSARIPVLNLAAGSCFPWTRVPETVENVDDAWFLRRIASYCLTTTVRDRVAQQLLRSLGVEAPLLPCTALLSTPRDLGESTKPRTRVLVNYMRGGGHYDYGQGVDERKWELTARDLVRRLARRHSVALLCHSEAEREIAEALVPGLECVLPRSAESYFEAVRGVKLGICNRIHAAVAIASTGAPAIAIGTDTRLLMAQEVGLSCVYVEDARVDLLEAEAEQLLTRAEDEQSRLLSLRDRTEREYLRILEAGLTTIQREGLPA